MRREPSILHVDLDAMFAAVEQRDKVSLRGRPVIVGGVAGRGVVATASYEARVYGARSAMPTSEARRRCPSGTAFLAPRFAAYRRTSQVFMAVLAELSPMVEQVSIDEAYVDLAAGGDHDLSPEAVTAIARKLKADVAAATGGVTASVGVASSKLVAKIGSELHKPDGLTVVPAGDERTVLSPMPVGSLPGVGPAAQERLRRAGVQTIGHLAAVELGYLLEWFGQAHGAGLYRLARADDDRGVVTDRETKSVSAEETFDVDLTDRARLYHELDLLARRVGERLRAAGLSGRTVTVKIRHYDFTTITRSLTRDQPTDDPQLVADYARRLLSDVNTSAGIRLLGVGVSTLTAYAQDDLFSSLVVPDGVVEEPVPQAQDASASASALASSLAPSPSPELATATWRPGQDVRHDEYGAGWVWGSGLGRVTVRFEGPLTPPGPVRTFAVDDAALHAADPPDWTS
ncbi:DNA polymerase IV [Winogradskya consettensis]|uniref:DNA polymerase IV n=1 Tax=Winogradskya consettensis TaxID=113560 RepID=A0A919T1Y6_9ACTN|nr:DNA polymerase IV [Actinoplanes consettensis]GIM83370.1 DNA polymerase IV [Actinoplanes consettensis]